MKFNEKTKEKNKTTNHEGAVAYTLDSKLELYSAVVTSMLSNKFYEGNDETIKRIRTLVETISKVDPSFIAKLAVYAREKMYLRSIPLVLGVELARTHSGDDLVSKTVRRIVQRADEITELLAYYEKANERQGQKKLGKLSKQIKKGLESSFNRFDEYAFGKYNRDGAIKLKDALFIVHPKAKDDKQQELFNKIATDTLETPLTWEVELSADKGQDKRGTWEKLIDQNSLGYMAALRNLRNILQAGVSDKHIEKITSFLSDKEAVLKSKQFPFRFLSAYREIKPVESSSTSNVLDALEEAVEASAGSIKGFDSNMSVVIACDVSGSMQHPISEKSTVQLYDIGLMLGMLLQSKCKKVQSGMFGDRWKIINLPKKSVLSNVCEYHSREGEVGYSTNGYLVLQDLIKKGEVVDKVMMFTDCQLWSTYPNIHGGPSIKAAWNEYKKIAPNAKMYLFDLAGYGTTPISTIKGSDVFLIAGFSDKVFDMLDAYEKGSSVLEEIDGIVL